MSTLNAIEMLINASPATPNTANDTELTREGTPRYEERPWGRFWVLDEGPGFKVKRIEVLPGKRLSYQRHARRSEHWIVVGGTLTVTLDGETYSVGTGVSVDIEAGVAHRASNQSSAPASFIEIQRGSYLGEDDIERLSDDFGRV
jgi:mannose-6-phosphate isomerase